jgi:hypothetical protein
MQCEAVGNTSHTAAGARLQRKAVFMTKFLAAHEPGNVVSVLIGWMAF